METITLNIREWRTIEDIYKDIALVQGYKSTVKEVQDKTQTNTYLEIQEVGDAMKLLPEGAFDMSVSTVENPTNTTEMTINYRLEVEIINPETETEFSKRKIQETLWALDLKVELAAYKIRGEKSIIDSGFKIV